MKNAMLVWAVLLGASAALPGCGKPTKTDPLPVSMTDEEITGLLIGKWRAVDGRVGLLTDYKKGGTTEFVDSSDPKKKRTAYGTWKVSGGTLSEEITATNDPNWMPKGQQRESVITALGERTVTAMSEGVSLHHTRVKD
jgi:hypothetical protein